MRFMEAFLIHCVLDASPPISQSEQDEIEDNQRLVAVRGRRPGATASARRTGVAIFDRAREIVDAVAEIAGVLDAGSRTRRYAAAVESCRAALDDPQRLPSAGCSTSSVHGRGVLRVRHAQVGEHRASLLATPLPDKRRAVLEAQAAAVVARSTRNRGRDCISFTELSRALLRQRPSRAVGRRWHDRPWRPIHPCEPRGHQANRNGRPAYARTCCQIAWLPWISKSRSRLELDAGRTIAYHVEIRRENGDLTFRNRQTTLSLIKV